MSSSQTQKALRHIVTRVTTHKDAYRSAIAVKLLPESNWLANENGAPSADETGSGHAYGFAFIGAGDVIGGRVVRHGRYCVRFITSDK